MEHHSTPSRTPAPGRKPGDSSAQPAKRAKPASRRPIPVGPSKQRAAPQRPEEDEEDRNPLADSFIREAPAWMISLVFHMVLLIIFGLLWLPALARQTIDLDAVYAEELGEQLEHTTFELKSMIDPDAHEPIFAEDEIPDTDPFAAMPELARVLDAPHQADSVEAPQIGSALSGRSEGLKKVLLAEYGGTESTEDAVKLGLKWLKRQQGRDGLWSLTGPYRDGVLLENKTAATAMALLAFQGAGHTHESGVYQDVVSRGWRALLARQGGDGDFYQPDGSQGIIPGHHLYTHAQATIAICELYGMTRDESLREPAELAIQFAAAAQSPRGGWRYIPGEDADLSVTGWYVMAFQSAMMAGIPVDPNVMEKTKEFLRTCVADDGIRYRYQGRDPTPDMTAEALLCWEYLGWSRDDERLVNGVKYLLRNPVDWEEKNFYYWYYAAQAIHHVEGEAWTEWNRVMRQVLPENQEKTGREAGSWSPEFDPEGTHGGRLYGTCMSIYCLEVYYRHLPIYRFQLE